MKLPKVQPIGWLFNSQSKKFSLFWLSMLNQISNLVLWIMGLACGWCVAEWKACNSSWVNLWRLQNMQCSFQVNFWFSEVNDYTFVNAGHPFFWLAVLNSSTWSKNKLSLNVTIQVCSCSSITECLGDECNSSPCPTNSSHHLWAWACWHLPRLVWVFRQLPKILWPFACGSFVLTTQEKVQMELNLVELICDAYIYKSNSLTVVLRLRWCNFSQEFHTVTLVHCSFNKIIDGRWWV